MSLDFIDEHRVDAVKGGQPLFELIGITFEVQVSFVVVQIDEQVGSKTHD